MFKNKCYVILGVLVLAVVMISILATSAKKSTTQVALDKVKKEDLKEPMQIQTQAQLIMQHFKNGENKLTIRLAKEYLTSNPNDTTIINALAEAYINEGDLSAAETTVRRAIAISPNDAWSCKLLVCIYRERGDLALALKQVEGGLASNPNNVMLLAEAAQIYSEQGNKVKANQTIDRALSINPKDTYLIQVKKGINEKIEK